MKKLQSGRSMVEMLGVLSIIGVLSIGGTVGYTIAMNNYQADQIIDASNKYSFHVFELCQKIYNNKKTGLQAIKFCSPATPGIQTFKDSKIAATPFGIYKQGISFSKIKETKPNVFEVYIEHKLKSKEVCETIKSLTQQKNGCIEDEAPYVLTIPFKQN